MGDNNILHPPPPPPPRPHTQLALIVSQSREGGGRLSGIKLSALSTGLQRVAREARRRRGKGSFRPPSDFNCYFVCSFFLSSSPSTASVHLPRIGYSTPNFNWYGTERLIRKHLAARGIPTYMYPRNDVTQLAHICTHTHTHTHTTTLLWWLCRRH